MAESGWRPEQTPGAYRGERVTGQTPCYAVMRTVSPVCIHSPVCSIPAPRICRARMGIHAGSALLVSSTQPWTRISCAGSAYCVSSGSAQASVSCASAPHLPGSSEHPARMHCASSTLQASNAPPVRPVPAPRTRSEGLVFGPVPPVPAPRIWSPVRLHSPELWTVTS